MPSKEVQKMIPKIQRYFATQPIERAYLFGSCSRGEETKNSDVDLLVTYTDSDKLSLLTICHIMNELSDQLGRTVDLVEERGLLPFAVPSVNKDKMLIYERANG
ncbi:MAG: nucleotidyltransferase domain-containing protein [Bacteroidales bacterium]|nr:nucleotidyltransferase domain-containing protein [Bacteroidales bacterium]